MYQQLVAKDLASKLKLIDASQHLVDARTRLDTNLGEQQKLAEQIAGAGAERDGFVQEWQRKLEALPWQQFGLAYGELKALTPDTLSDDNARETGEEGSSPELKKEARQSPTHYRARIELTESKFATCRRASQCGPACASSATSKSAAARYWNTC
jgi:hypothetical protein